MLFNKMALIGPHIEIIVIAVSNGGETKNYISKDLDKKYQPNNNYSDFYFNILLGCIAIVLTGVCLICVLYFSSIRKLKDQQVLEMQQKSQETQNKTVEFDLIKDTLQNSFDVLRHLSDDPMEIDQKNITIYNVIGIGEFGLVKKGILRNHDGGEINVAVKMLKCEYGFVFE